MDIDFMLMTRRLLRADQKAKARSRLAPSPSESRYCLTSLDGSRDGSKMMLENGGPRMTEDDMVFFWQCQSPGQTGDLKGCGFFRILDMKAEGRGPCVGDL